MSAIEKKVVSLEDSTYKQLHDELCPDTPSQRGSSSDTIRQLTPKNPPRPRGIKSTLKCLRRRIRNIFSPSSSNTQMKQVVVNNPTFSSTTTVKDSDLSSSTETPTVRRKLYILSLIGHDLTKAFNSGKILVGDTHGESPLQTILDGQQIPDGITVDAASGQIFWTLMGTFGKLDGSILSSDLQGGNVRTIIPTGVLHTPKQMTLDPVTQKLYFCDREGLRVMRCNMDGTALETLVQTGNMEQGSDDPSLWCVGVAISHAEGKLYWTQKGPPRGNQGRIFCAGIDIPEGQTASTRSDIKCLLDKLPEPIDLHFKEKRKALYWTDRGEVPLGCSLNRAFIGNSVREVKSEILAYHLCQPIGLIADEESEHLFVSSMGGRVYRFGMNGEDKRLVYDGGCPLTGIAIL